MKRIAKCFWAVVAGCFFSVNLFAIVGGDDSHKIVCSEFDAASEKKPVYKKEDLNGNDVGTQKNNKSK